MISTILATRRLGQVRSDDPWSGQDAARQWFALVPLLCAINYYECSMFCQLWQSFLHFWYFIYPQLPATTRKVLGKQGFVTCIARIMQFNINSYNSRPIHVIPATIQAQKRFVSPTSCLILYTKHTILTTLLTSSSFQFCLTRWDA